MDDSVEEFSKREQKKLRKEEDKQKEKSAKAGKNIITLLVIVGIIGAIGYGLLKLSDPQTSFSTPLSQAVEDIDHFKGNAEASVVLVEYGDYECPGCAAYAPLVAEAAETFKDDIKVVFRHFPLPGHTNSVPAAYAAEAAAKQGKFWEMTDLLYISQGEWAQIGDPKPLFDGYAQSLELNMDQFNADYDSQEVKNKVDRDLKTGNDSNVNSTPTFFLNGDKIERLPSSPEEFFNIIQKEIDEQSK